MLRAPKVIEYLNMQLTNELTAVNQYFLHARTLEHWGVTKLGTFEYGESIGEMKHAGELIQRILFLDGLPNVQRLNPIQLEDGAVVRQQSHSPARPDVLSPPSSAGFGISGV